MKIHAMSDAMIDNAIKYCHRILKDGTQSWEVFKKAERMLPRLAQERDKRYSIKKLKS